MYANVLKFHIWIPHENMADPYFFFLSELPPILEYRFDKITPKSRIFVLLLPSWASIVGVKQCSSQAVFGT